MRASIVLQSLYPDTPVYTWSAKDGWVQKDPVFKMPDVMWISNQTGIRVGTYGAVQVPSYQDLLFSLPSVMQDLVLDAVECIGFKNTKNVSATRWAKLESPRPECGEREPNRKALYVQYGERFYMLDVDVKGRGGWFAVPGIPADIEFSTFPMWDYTVYSPPSGSPRLSSCAARRLITATLDNLYCYPKDDAIRSYLVWAQSQIHAMWEAYSDDEGKGVRKPN